jgi:hypothetical protein
MASAASRNLRDRFPLFVGCDSSSGGAVLPVLPSDPFPSTNFVSACHTRFAPTAAHPAVVAAGRATSLDAAVWPDAYRQCYKRQLEDHVGCAGQICLDGLILMPTWTPQIVS